MDTKVCAKCKQSKSKDLFYKDKSNIYGYSYYCKACDQEKKRAYYKRIADNHQKSPTSIDAKQCIRCLQTKCVEHFCRDINIIDGYKQYCKTCMAEKAQELKIAKHLTPNHIELTCKKCNLCGETKAHSSFRKTKASKDGLGNICLDCKPFAVGWTREDYNKANFEYRKRNPEKVRDRARKRRENAEYRLKMNVMSRLNSLLTSINMSKQYNTTTISSMLNDGI